MVNIDLFFLEPFICAHLKLFSLFRLTKAL